MKNDFMMWIGFSWLRISFVAGSPEQGNERLGSIEGEEYLNQLSDYQLIRELSAPHGVFQSDSNPAHSVYT
jgi:hypothetical protein